MTKISFSDSLDGYALTNRDLFQTTDAGANWHVLLHCSGCVGFDDFQFGSRGVGYVVRDSGTEANNENYDLLRTTDEGMSWRSVIHEAGGDSRTSYLDNLFFLNADTGYILLDVSSDHDDRYYLLRTQDGSHFARIGLPTRRPEITAMDFIKGTSVGYVAVLDDTWHLPWLLKTVDGGGDSLSFWEPNVSLPEGNKKGCLLAYVPDSQSLYRLDFASGALWSCRIDSNLWTAHRAFPGKPKFSGMTYDGNGLVVTMSNSNLVWSYDPGADSWYQLPALPKDAKVKSGGGLTSDAGDPVFVLPGGKANKLWSYERGDTNWQRLPDVPGAPVTSGGCVTCDNDYVYIFKGGKLNEFWAFDIENDSWLRLPDIPGSGIKSGSSLCADKQGGSDNLLALKSGNTECWSYELDGYWKLLPGIPGKGNQGKGSQLAVDDAGTWYAIKGKGKRFAELWQTCRFSHF